jgi:hypothetical protein
MFGWLKYLWRGMQTWWGLRLLLDHCQRVPVAPQLSVEPCKEWVWDAKMGSWIKKCRHEGCLPPSEPPEPMGVGIRGELYYQWWMQSQKRRLLEKWLATTAPRPDDLASSLGLTPPESPAIPPADHQGLGGEHC